MKRPCVINDFVLTENGDYIRISSIDCISDVMYENECMSSVYIHGIEKVVSRNVRDIIVNTLSLDDAEDVHKVHFYHR